MPANPNIQTLDPCDSASPARFWQHPRDAASQRAPSNSNLKLMVVGLGLHQAPKRWVFWLYRARTNLQALLDCTLNVGMNLWKLLCGEVVGLFEERSCCLHLGLILISVGSQPTTMGDYQSWLHHSLESHDKSMQKMMKTIIVKR